jgi:hypothetical protein
VAYNLFPAWLQLLLLALPVLAYIPAGPDSGTSEDVAAYYEYLLSRSDDGGSQSGGYSDAESTASNYSTGMVNKIGTMSGVHDPELASLFGKFTL